MSVTTALAKAITAAVAADTDLTDLAGDAVWFETTLPNKDKAYPQACIDAKFSTPTGTKEGFHASTVAYVSVWFETKISVERRAEALVEGIIAAVHRTTQDGVHICAEDYSLIHEQDTGLSRYRIGFEMMRVSAV